MNQKVLAAMGKGSPEHVILHAKYRKTKGRRPSMVYGNIRNPRKALAGAVNEVIARRLMKFDAFDVAERITGTSYKEDGLAMNLGMGMHLLRTQGLKKTLKNMDDSTYSSPLESYLRIVQEEGFEILLVVPFTDEEGREEKLHVLFHKADGILLVFDTYGGKSVNGGNFYYNWKPVGEDYIGKDVLSSGGYREVNSEFIWVGHHDCREAIRIHLRDLRRYGKFVTPWVEQPFLWILHYMDTRDKGYDYRVINHDRMSKLPTEVRKVIGFIN